jgi:hypothetical protein
MKKKSSKKKHESIPIEETKDVHFATTTTNDESFSTEGFDIEQEIQQPIPMPPESKVIYHKVGGKLKKHTSGDRTKTKRNKISTTSQAEPLILVPRKAAPFISATKDQQINVEEDIPIKRKKKKRKSSCKFSFIQLIRCQVYLFFHEHDESNTFFFNQSVCFQLNRIVNVHDPDHQKNN